MAKEDVELVRQVYERWSRGENAMELFDPDVRWSSPHPDASAVRGREELAAFMRRYVGTWEDYGIEPHEIRDIGQGRVLVFFSEHMRGKGSGVEGGMRAAVIWTISEGKVVRYQAYLEASEALEAAGLQG
jgi:ketosteroid isomerase-like protein